MNAERMQSLIIPAAGLGIRWKPVSEYLPKEMLPLVDKPVVHYIVREAIESGFKNIIIVTNKDKKIIRDYFNKQTTLNGIDLQFTYQDKPLGIADAMRTAKKFVNGSFAVMLPDLPTISTVPVILQMKNIYSKMETNSCLISLSMFPKESLGLYSNYLSTAKNKNLGIIEHFCSLKNCTENHGNKNFRLSGKYIFPYETFEHIEKLKIEKNVGEITDVDLLNQLQKNGYEIYGYKIKGRTYDTGNARAHLRANTAFFKHNVRI